MWSSYGFPSFIQAEYKVGGYSFRLKNSYTAYMSQTIRYLNSQVKQDLQRKMVFVGGPRQVGKATLAKHLLENQQGYMNWDIAQDRERILKHELPPTSMWVFD